MSYFENKAALRQAILKKIDKPAIKIDVKELRILLACYNGPFTQEERRVIEEMKNNLLRRINAENTLH